MTEATMALRNLFWNCLCPSEHLSRSRPGRLGSGEQQGEAMLAAARDGRGNRLELELLWASMA